VTEKKNRLLMRINGQEYPIAGMEPKEYLLRVGVYVDEKMQEISRNNRQLSLSQIAMLTSINMADEVLKLQDAYNDLQKTAPPTDEDVAALKKELEQKTNSLQQEKDYTRNLQKRLNNVKQEQEKLRETHQETVKQLSGKDQELVKAQQLIRDLQEQLFDNQMKVAELQKKQQQERQNPFGQ
jgi:cell division protein ZapA